MEFDALQKRWLIWIAYSYHVGKIITISVTRESLYIKDHVLKTLAKEGYIVFIITEEFVDTYSKNNTLSIKLDITEKGLQVYNSLSNLEKLSWLLADEELVLSAVEYISIRAYLINQLSLEELTMFLSSERKEIREIALIRYARLTGELGELGEIVKWN